MSLLGRFILLLLVALLGPASVPGSAPAASAPPHIKHFFVIVLENENASVSFGPEAPAPYLAKTLRAAGAFLPNYYGTGHHSLDNYLSLISGQPPNEVTQGDCPTFLEMTPGTLAGDGVARGQGCVFPGRVKNVANQLEAAGIKWRGYMQDMAGGAGPGESKTCRHPAIGAADNAFVATASNRYATRHDPFVYFHSIIDHPTCQENVVDLARLTKDLRKERTTPAYSFITPDLCADGHDAVCPESSLPGGFAGIEAFLREWVPRIKASAAYKDRGAILITFDESETGAESCCGEKSGPNTPNNGDGVATGNGGGQVGAVVLSPCVRAGTVANRPYNHYSTLRWVEDNFGLEALAEAAKPAVRPFGTDVFDSPACAARKR